MQVSEGQKSSHLKHDASKHLTMVNTKVEKMKENMIKLKKENTQLQMTVSTLQKQQNGFQQFISVHKQTNEKLQAENRGLRKRFETTIQRIRGAYTSLHVENQLLKKELKNSKSQPKQKPKIEEKKEKEDRRSGGQKETSPDIFRKAISNVRYRESWISQRSRSSSPSILAFQRLVKIHFNPS